MTDLHVMNTPAPRARGTVLIVHGLGEHSGRYARLAQELRDDGWSTVLYDQRGHGRSPGARGVIPGATALLEDLAAVIDRVKARPLVLFGHSMGGAVAARFVAEGLEERPAAWCRYVDALVLSSPALMRRLAWKERLKLALGRLTPNVAVRNGLDSSKISHDPAVVQAYRSDPLVHDRISPRLVHFILDSGELVRERAPRWRVPTLLLWAGDDALVDARGSELFAAASPHAVVETHGFPALYHELFNESEPGRGKVLEVLREWLGRVVK